MRTICTLFVALLFTPLLAHAQVIPSQALHARSVVVLNETHAFAVQRGAEAELKHSGRLKVVADLDVADLVLSFRNKPAPQSAAGTPESARVIEMAVSTRDRVAPFFRTETDMANEQAGQECVDAFLLAWNKAQVRH